MNKDLALKVLKYWHQVEFFQLMEVKALKDPNNLLNQLTYRILENEKDCLPWRDRSRYKYIKSKKTVKKDISYKYKLYLGIFERAEITKLAKEKFPSINIEEIREDFGETCSATIMVNKNGVLDINSLKLSTCPWAIGKLNADKLSEITFKEFKESSEDLKQEINKVIETAKKIRHEANLPDDDADYSGKMFHAEDYYEMDGCEIWGKSCWIHVPGKADGKFVREQGEAVLGLIVKYHQKTGFMPELYIISPFRNVKNSVKDIIAKDKYLKANAKDVSLNDWVKERIGTVHTFQGKEESNVLFVLGADTESEGAAKWAAGTCNILNVAVTRAKKYVYIIGDYNLWSPLSHFKEAAEILGEPKNIDDLLGNQIRNNDLFDLPEKAAAITVDEM